MPEPALQDALLVQMLKARHDAAFAAQRARSVEQLAHVLSIGNLAHHFCLDLGEGRAITAHASISRSRLQAAFTDH